MSSHAPAPSSPRNRRAAPAKGGKPPVGPGAVTVVGALLAVMVVGLGAVGLQTAASASGITQSTPWLTRLLLSTDGLRPVGWMLPVAALLVVVGLWLLVTALRPRPRTALALDAATGVFIPPRDLARLAQHAADDVDGVARARATASRSRVVLVVDSTGGAGVADAVKDAVRTRLSGLRKPPRVSVKTTEVPR